MLKKILPDVKMSLEYIILKKLAKDKAALEFVKRTFILYFQYC